MSLKLIIDPGHGGQDSGGGTNKHWKEKDKVLEISKYQYERFRELGVDVELTRERDVYLGPSERSTKVKTSGAKLCISNHINAGGGDGAEVIHSIYNDGKLANEIADELKKTGQNIRRVFSLKGKTGKDYYYMHRLTGSVTTMIVEYGFADTKLDDVEQLQKDWRRYAEAVVKAVCEYYGVNYQLPNKNVDKLEIIANMMIEYNISIEEVEKFLKTRENRVKKLRYYDTDIYVFESRPDEELKISIGERYGKLEKLSAVHKLMNAKASINAGFFNFNGSRENLGSLGFNGLHYHNPDPTFIDVVIHENKMDVRFIKDNMECVKLQADKDIYFGTSYSLVRDGKKDLTNAKKFDHSKYRNPRTMFGQKLDGTWIFAVADGRSKQSKGLTAEQESQIMYQLGCHNAVNLDGGGSSQMVAGGETQNNPSDGRERPQGTSVHIM